MPAATFTRHSGLAHVRRLSQYEHFHTEASGTEQSSYGMCFRIPFISGPATVSLTLETRLYCYRPPTELPEGKVYSRVCLSTGGCHHVPITHDALYLTVQGPPDQPLDTMGPP